MLIFDTAGRQEIDERLIAELKRLHDFLKPKETLLVADSATGQQAVSVAKHFDEAVGITGIVLTKLDGDARGGAALSMRAVTGKPIKYAGEGEKLDQLFEFHPDRMADRILGMGDIVGMVEQVAGKVNEEDAMRSMKRMQEGKFDFTDFLDQMNMIQNLGPLEGLLGMMPGFNKIKKQLPVRRAQHRKDQTHRGHRALDDPRRTPPPGNHQGLAPPAHRRRLRHLAHGGQPAHQTIRTKCAR